jgi:sugar/nucleoside kinase (ribokinase family)
VTSQEPTTTVAILGADTVVENALSLLLGGAGYSTKVLEDPSAFAANAEEHLQGVDLLLLTPSLREETQEGFLKAIEAAPAASGVPVLTLSTAPQGEPNDPTAGVVPWPTPLENLRLAIEAALVSAPGDEPGGVERPPSAPAGHGGAAAREECA